MKEEVRDDLILFFTKLSIFLTHDVPLVKALKDLAEYTKNEDLRKAANEIKNKIVDGKSFSQSLEEFPDLFDRPVINLLRAGEEALCLSLVSRIIPEYILFNHDQF